MYVCLAITLTALLLLAPLILAQNATNNTINTVTAGTDDKEKIEAGFSCLEEKGGDCSSLTLQETALTILASPENILDSCVTNLLSRASSEHFGSVRDTALAILALDHAGIDTTTYENWLLTQERNPTDLQWYLQQDSNGATECSISYGSETNALTYSESKKVSGNAGSCLTRANSNYWLEVDPDCYETTFTMQCDKEFIASFLYKNKDSGTIYVIEETHEAPAYGNVELTLKSKCFGDSGSCNYEATAWATLALQTTGHETDLYIPYLMALADTNKRYLPDAFIYLVTDYEDYANALLESQSVGNYWQAEQSPYGRYYDTALALLSLGRTTSSERITNARNQLLFSQGSNGCWANSARDTAIVLWALEGRAGKSTGNGGSVTLCSSANFYCIADSQCPETEKKENYYCSGLSTVCCENEHLQACSEMQGTTCPSGQVCSGNVKKASDAPACCLGTCGDPNTKTECELAGSACRSACSSQQEQVSLICNQGQICCKTKIADEGGSSWTLIVLLLVLIALTVFAIIYRKKLGLWLFALKARFRKGKPGPNGSVGQGPMRPGGPRGPPGRPMMPPRPGPMPSAGRQLPAPMQRPSIQQPHDKEFSETFGKLRSFSK